MLAQQRRCPNWVLAARRSRLLVNEMAPCRGTDSLRWFSPATQRGQTLAEIRVSVVCGAGRAPRVVHSPGAMTIAPGP